MNETFHKLQNRFSRKFSGAGDEDAADEVNDELKQPAKYTPQSLRELMEVLRRTPRTVLSNQERAIIASAVTFAGRKVADIMTPLLDVPYVREDDFLGPFMLDKLYKSGLSHFPVVGKRGQIIGVIHTESLNSLEIKEADQAAKYLDPHVFFVRDDYTLEQALAALLRTNCFFFIVLDRAGQTVGMLTYKDLTAAIFGVAPADNFTQDGDAFAVAHRDL